MTGDDRQYIPRGSWVKVDFSNYPTVKIPERFGHAMATVSGSRVLIYGGIGCAVWTQTGFCESTLVLNDLWEFDVMRWAGSGNPLKALDLSPLLSGLAGPSLIAIPGEDHRVLTFGGSSVMYPMMELLGIPQQKSEDKFEYRQLLFRASKAENLTVDGMEAISSSSIASNETHVMLVGGYLGNARTAAVHTYNLAASSPELALQPLPILATGPSARSMPGVVKPDDRLLLMFGGVVHDNNNGVTRHIAIGDLWQFDLNTQSWLKIHDSVARVNPRAYGAFGSVSSGAETVLFTYGGLVNGFHAQVLMRGGEIERY